MERVITIKEPEVYQEDYQMRMLMSNEIPGLLPLRGRGVDGSSCYDYVVSGKISMKALYERGKMTRQDLQHFLTQLKAVLKEVEKHLLHTEALLMRPEYLFYEEDVFYFCYYPPMKQDFWKEFHTLSEYLIKRADYSDRDCAKMVLYLHKETMKENYSLEKVIEGCLAAAEEQPAGVDPDTAGADALQDPASDDDFRGKSGSGYDREGHDWEDDQEKGASIMEETDHMWKPMKRFLNRRKKQKWGDWDGLYIEEEDFTVDTRKK